MPLMSLASTNEKLISIFEELEREGSLGYDISRSSTSYLDNFNVRYRNNVLFTFTRFRDVSPLPIAFYVKSITLYRNATGKTANDLSTDFFYHWMTGYSAFTTYEQIRTAILDKEMCGSFGLTIGLNKYIKDNNLNRTQIKALLKGSPWRWYKYVSTGFFVQKSLYYHDGTEHFPTMLGLNSTFCKIQEYSWTLISFKEYIHNRCVDIQRRIDYALELERNRPRELAGHSTKATNHFSFKSSPKKAYHHFLGIELELEGFSQKEFKTLDTLKDHAIFKRDGSLNEGVEICSAPATLDVHKEAFHSFFEAIVHDKSELVAKSTCGLHIHIDKSKLTKLHIANIHQLVNNKENRSFLNALAGRSPNNYCQVFETDYSTFTQERSGDRYRMVNLSPSETIELRFFASTTDEKSFNTRLDLAQALVDYCKPGTMAISLKELYKWNHFRSYVLKHRRTYPDLVKGI